MKPNLPNDLGKSLVRFFQDYLPTLRGLSQHTIHGYRDAIVLFLRYLTEHTGRPIEQLNLNDLSADTVAQFLAFIEQKRGNSIATRNARLAALHTLARFLASDNPERLANGNEYWHCPSSAAQSKLPSNISKRLKSRPSLAKLIAPLKRVSETTRCFA
jgi:site-specific recombinase XerD